MHNRQRQQRIEPKTLRVFQANVAKTSPIHDCALALADSEKFDIVLLQEPWTTARDSRCLTKTHPAYDTFSPIDSWDDNSTRPRVMTYVRRGRGLLLNQVRPSPSRDILWLVVNNIVVVNFYRQPGSDNALDELLKWPIPSSCLIAGDFNAKHLTWQSGLTSSQGRGTAIADWALENDLCLLNTPDVPTNAHGNTVDLAFSNISMADAMVEDHLATSSDHFTLSLSIPSVKGVPLQPGKIRVKTEEELLRFVELVEDGLHTLPCEASVPEELDALAYSLVKLLRMAAQGAGRPSRKTARCAPWWTKDCAKAASDYRAIRRCYPLGFNYEVQVARKKFQGVVGRAKREYWRTLIDSFSDGASVFKAVRWLKSPGAFQPPPLQVEDTVYETQQDKAEALRKATLERRDTNDDISDPWQPTVPSPTKAIPFSSHVSLAEARDVTLRTGNTSPGPDNITVKLLQSTWHLVGPYIQRLYEGCLTAGYHPRAFKNVEVVMIAKPGRRDLSTPRAWRPISLLSCVGKGLERLIARRMSWAAINSGVLHPQQAGALPKRSAVDLVAALVHDIEVAFAKGQVATMVTMDIQGAFDTVLRNRLVLRLRQQGWPQNLARWVGSFMLDRSACVRYQDITTASKPLQCGLPQGSPVSPILFLLYTEPIYRLSNTEGRFGYADDTAILCVGNSLAETAAKASKQVEELIAWGAANGITFDPKKTEVMHFSRSRIIDTPSISHGDIEKKPEKSLRWLGIWLDSKLGFKAHVGKWANKAHAVACHLRGLANTRHGPLPSALRRAVKACVEPILLYGIEAWYPGLTRPNWANPKKESRSGVQQLLQRMQRILSISIRAILPVWKTTPIAVLHRESGIPPIEQLVEACRNRFAVRLKSLDEAHPLVQRTLPTPATVIYPSIKLKYQRQPSAFRTRLRRTNELIPACNRPKLLQQAFYPNHDKPLQSASKEESADMFRRWIETLPPLTLVVYSDGSKSAEGDVGYGFVVHQNGETALSGSGRLGPAEVFDAEAMGALEGLRAALSHPDAPKTEIVVCLDNIAAATCLRGNPSDSSQDVFLKFQLLADAHGATEIRWVPGHTDVLGNEQADELAKAGTAMPEPLNATPTLAYLRRIAKQRPKDAFAKWWATAATDKYRPLGLECSTKCPPELALSRTTLHHLLAARSHHGDFTAYHLRFNHKDARLNCSCGRQKAPDHLFYCRKISPRHRLRLTPSPAAAIRRVIGREYIKFVKIAEASAFFDRICHRY